MFSTNQGSSRIDPNSRIYIININYGGQRHQLNVRMKIDSSYTRVDQRNGGRNIPYKPMDQFVQHVRAYFNLTERDIILFKGASRVDGSETHLNMFDIIANIADAPESNPATFTLVKVPVHGEGRLGFL